ncbi:MAG: response regulator, partial [Mariniphaga sp.]|nr:response regulator [Mariniphaga sp.]
MKLYKFKSIRTRLTYWIFLFALIPLLITMTITYFQSANNIEVEALDKLTAIRGLKVQQVESWLDNRLGDLQVMSEDFEIRNLEYLFVKKSKSPEDFDKLDAAKNLLNRYLRNFNDYTEIFIIDANTGLVELSTNPDMESMNKFHNSFFNVPLETGEKYIKDIYYSETLGKPEMTFSMPIFCLTHKTHIIGILVVRINLYESLYKLLLNRTGLGETGETLIINKDVVALNELRWYENAPLNLQINAEPAINASQGKTGITVTTDYRGEDILAAYTYLPETSWGFVCKQDLRELNAPIRKMTVNFVFIFGVITIIIFFISLYISKSISKPIINMSLVSQKLEAGNLSERINTNDEDELGSLAKSLNSMADAIESRIEIQQGVSAISKTMIDQTTMQEFGSELLKQLMKITVANMSTFYIINEATSEYEHFFSVGANKELLKPFNVENPEGEVGNALSTKSIYYLRDIPEDTIFKYRTTAGEVIPKEIITIPIVVEDSVVALISLVSIQKFSNECFEILKNSWTNINTSYSNLVAGERTRVLAEHLSRINQQLEAQSEELQDQAEELQDQTAELQHSSEELQEQNIELEAQRKQVEASNKLKSEFLSNMSHELRTPLNSIMGLSQVLMMQAKNKLSDVENNHLAIIERNGKRLLTLINDILDLSKIEAGKIEMETEFISLAYLLQTIKENMYVFSEPKGLEINLTVAENLPAIESDETKLYQALTNIVGNAVKFTEKGSIDITVINNPENVFIEVKDSGIGIPEEELPYIFDQFRQADGSSIRQYEGTGLGLAIANKMITLLGGNISVQSTLGKGSVFKITLPLKWNDDISSTRSNSFGNLPVQSTGSTILVVDDDQKTVDIISDYLNEAGYKTIKATSGKEALKLAEQYKPFAITLDIVMEDMDGWEVLQKLKNNIITRSIPVIIVSVSDDRDTGFALGAVGFIIKPVNKHVLISNIKKVKNMPDFVMIVDDNEFELTQISKIIEAEKIKTIRATSGKECIKLLNEKIPDILILDLMMPEMD